MSTELLKTTEGPGLPLVARLYVQGRYQRASVDPNHSGQALTFLSAAGEWRQKAELRQAMIDQLTAELDSLRATPTPPVEPAAWANMAKDGQVYSISLNERDQYHDTPIYLHPPVEPVKEADVSDAEIAELRARLQEVGAMARENRSRAIVALEAELLTCRNAALEEAAKEVERIGPKGSVALLTKGFADAIRALRGGTP